MNRDALIHEAEFEENRRAWSDRTLLREIYRDLGGRLLPWIDASLAGRIVDIGSGVGHLRAVLPSILLTDLFCHPEIDLVANGFKLPFVEKSVSHLTLFDVFHHLEWPAAFFCEARRVLVERGRVLILDPYISGMSRGIYGAFHHEPVGWKVPISDATSPGVPSYYAVQAQATRSFFGSRPPPWLRGWTVIHREAFSCFDYLLSGGFSKPAFYPRIARPVLQRMDRILSRFPRMFAARCVVVLEKDETPEP